MMKLITSFMTRLLYDYQMEASLTTHTDNIHLHVFHIFLVLRYSENLVVPLISALVVPGVVSL